MVKLNTIEHLEFKLKQVTPVIYLLSEDEHRTILGISEIAKKMKKGADVHIYKSTTGFLSIDDYTLEINQKENKVNEETIEINDALIRIYTEKKKNLRQIFIMTEADYHLDDAQVLRRIKDFSVQADSSDSNLKTLILLSSKLFLPDKLEKYVDVLTYPYPSEDEIKNEIVTWVSKFNKVITDKNKLIEARTDFEVVNALKGLITPQIHQALTACIHITKKRDKCASLEPRVLNSLKREAINKTSLLTFREPKVSFKDVGGLGRLKKWLQKMHGGWTNEGQKFGLPILKGVLLIGLPGCGKSRICEALANEWGLNLITFDPSRVFSSRLGESEGNMHLAVSRIESLAPCVLFVDEIEKSLAGIQSSAMSDAGTTARTISIFLIWMNDSQSWVFTTATSNQINFVPPELVSRFDEIFYVGPPDVSERKEILEIQIKENNREPKDFDIDKLSRVSSYLSGREIKQAVAEAMYDAFHLRKDNDDDSIDLNDEILANALKRKIPIIQTMEEQLKYLAEWVGYDKKRRDGIKARIANNDIDEIDTMFSQILTTNKSSNNI